MHQVKVTEDVEKLLVGRATERQITVSRLLVESAVAGGADVAARDAALAGELFRLTRFLAKVGVNVNQIARVTNATLETQPETAAAMDALVRTCARLDGLVEDLRAARQ